jgi:hypothetical protein
MDALLAQAKTLIEAADATDRKKLLDVLPFYLLADAQEASSTTSSPHWLRFEALQYSCGQSYFPGCGSLSTKDRRSSNPSRYTP